MIKEMDFFQAVKFSRDLKCSFRPEFSDYWIGWNFCIEDQYHTPVFDKDGNSQYFTLRPEVLNVKRWEFLITEDRYNSILKDRERPNLNKVSSEQFPSPVRLCNLKCNDMFRRADDIHSGLYCSCGKDSTGMISAVNFEESPDSYYYAFSPDTLVYKADKNGEIVDATSEI